MSFSTECFATPAFDKVASVSTGAEIAVGTVARGTDNSEHVYVQANGAITQFDAVAVDAGQAAPLSATNAVTGVVIGVSQVAMADNEYGWIQTRGAGSVNVLASAATDVQLMATATAGSLDDAGTIDLTGITLTETDGGSGGPVTCNIGSDIGVSAFV